MEFGLFFFIQLSSVILSLSDWIVCISTGVLIGVCISTIVCPSLDDFIHWIGRRIVSSDWSSNDRLSFPPFCSPLHTPCFLTLCSGWKLWDKTMGLLIFTQARVALRYMCLRE